MGGRVERTGGGFKDARCQSSPRETQEKEREGRKREKSPQRLTEVYRYRTLRFMNQPVCHSRRCSEIYGFSANILPGRHTPFEVAWIVASLRSPFAPMIARSPSAHSPKSCPSAHASTHLW